MKIEEGIFVTDSNIVQYVQEREHAGNGCDALSWFVDNLKKASFTYDASVLDQGKRGVFVAFHVFLHDELNLCALRSRSGYFENQTRFRDAFPDLPYEEEYVRVVE